MRVNRLAVVLVLAAAAAPPAFAQELATPKTWEEALASLRNALTVDEEATGHEGRKGLNYRAYEVFRDRTPLATLVTLTDDDDPVVRCYAFRALVACHAFGPPAGPGGDLDLPALLEKHFDDDAKVETYRGTGASKERVCDVMFGDLRGHLGESEETRLVQRIVFGRTESLQQYTLLREFKFPREDLPRLRAITDWRASTALVAIARLRDPIDAPRIALALRAPPENVTEMHDEFVAASLHPAPILWPYLRAFEPAAQKQLVERRRWWGLESWLAAVAAHDTEESVAVLERFLEPELQGLNAIYRARQVLPLAKAGDRARNTGLLWKLWVDHGVVDAEVIDYLKGLHAARVRKQAELDLRTRVNDLHSESVGALLDFLRVADRDRATAVLADVLGKAEVFAAKGAIPRAARWREKAHVEPLFKLYAHDNPWVYIAAARALLAYNDPEIDERLETTAEREGWGGEKLRHVLADKPRTWEAGGGDE